MIELFTMLFRLTGLNEAKARFQVVSMLTSSGFTTSESELMLTSILRRKLAQFTMVFGTLFNIAFVSLILNVFVNIGNRAEQSLTFILYYLTGFVIIFIVIGKTKFVKIGYDNLIKRFGLRLMFRNRINPYMVLDTYHDNVIAEVLINELPEILKNKTLGEAGVRNKFNLQIMMIKHKNNLAPDVGPDTKIYEGDIVVVFGTTRNIRALFSSGN